MNFISERQSLASNFAQETENNSSLLSSKRYHDHIQNDLHEFQEEINLKFIRSIANKMYTYPLGEEGYDLIHDEEDFEDLIGVQEYDLYEQTPENVNFERGFKKEQFKQKKGNEKQQQKLNSKTANLLLSTLQAQISRINNLRSYVGDNFKRKRSNSKGSKQFRIIQEEPEVEKNQKRRLQTEPYEKPMGFIIKKK